MRQSSFPSTIPDTSCRSGKVAHASFSKIGSPLTAAMEFDDVDALKQGTRENLGIGFVAQNAVEGEIARGTLVVVNVEGLPFERDILIVVDPPRKLSPGAELLVRIARDLPQ